LGRRLARRSPPSGDAERSADPTLLGQFAGFMSSAEMPAFFREVTGAPEIDLADAQATAYSPGDFLTAHSDDVSGKGRRAAYVLGLTRGWRTDRGGSCCSREGAAM
jgi:SM-20-related protein